MVTLNTITWLIDGDKLIVFYCLSASEVRPNKGMAFCGNGIIRGVTSGGSGLVKRETNVPVLRYFQENHWSLQLPTQQGLTVFI